MLKNYLYGVYGLYYLALSTGSYSYYPIDVVRNLNCKWAHLGSIGITCSEFKLKTTLQDALQYFVDFFNLWMKFVIFSTGFYNFQHWIEKYLSTCWIFLYQICYCSTVQTRKKKTHKNVTAIFQNARLLHVTQIHIRHLYNSFFFFLVIVIFFLSYPILPIHIIYHPLKRYFCCPALSRKKNK